jgi:hypothetical protein
MSANKEQGETQQGNEAPEKPPVKPPVVTPKPVIQGSETKDGREHGSERRVSKS